MRIQSLFLLLFTLLLARVAYAQDKTEAERDEMLAYLKQYDVLENMLILDMQQYNLIHLNRDISKAQQQEERQKYADKMAQNMKAFEAIAAPKGYEHLRKTMLAYLKTIEVSVKKTLSGFYLREAEKKFNCNSCIEAILYSYELDRKDPETDGDAIINQLDFIMSDIAKKFNLTITIPVEQRRKAERIEKGQEYIIDVITVLSEITKAYSDLGSGLQKISAQKGDTSQFTVVMVRYQKACKEALRLLEKLPQDFEGDKTIWQTAKSFCLMNDKFASVTLVEITQIFPKKQPSEAEKKRINAGLKEFNDLGPLMKNYSMTINNFLKKLVS